MNVPRRALALLIHPSAEWSTIAARNADAATVFREYVAAVAAVPAVSVLAGLAISVGHRLGSLGMVTALVAAIIGYVMSLAGVAISALTIRALAPRFKANGGIREAVTLVGHALTPFWLAGVFYVFAELSPLSIVGMLYAIYLFYLGVSPVMGTPVDQRAPYTLVCTMTVLVTSVVLRSIASLIRAPYYAF